MKGIFMATNSTLCIWVWSLLLVNNIASMNYTHKNLKQVAAYIPSFSSHEKQEFYKNKKTHVYLSIEFIEAFKKATILHQYCHTDSLKTLGQSIKEKKYIIAYIQAQKALKEFECLVISHKTDLSPYIYNYCLGAIAYYKNALDPRQVVLL